jgi:hypothetical protein
MSDPTPLSSETKLDELKRLCEPMNGEPMRTVTRVELLALVECAEVLQTAYIYLVRDDRAKALKALKTLEVM